MNVNIWQKLGNFRTGKVEPKYAVSQELWDCLQPYPSIDSFSPSTTCIFLKVIGVCVCFKQKRATLMAKQSIRRWKQCDQKLHILGGY